MALTLETPFQARTPFASDQVEILTVTDDRKKKVVTTMVELGGDPSFHYSMSHQYEDTWSEADLELAIRAWFEAEAQNGG